jgi:Asp-tRNA(Asn)/Glu-tRNA(Gln) amidotransferase A subunit family amidase
MLLLPKWEQVIDSNVLFSMISTMGAIWATIILQRLLGGQKRRRELAKLGRQAVAERDGKAHTCLSLQSGATADWKKEDMQIAMLSCSELRMAMRKGKLSCERIMLAFCRRSHELGRLGVNAVTEELYDEALATARALDISGILLAKEEDPLKPLLGLPVSIKDSVDQEGCFSSCGLARLVHPEKRSKKDSVVVSLLRDAGAIPFVRTNTPQLLMMAETDNFVWGRTDNPWNTKRTPGGSSGGEAALVSLRASPLGLGSDIGGSIRIPSSFCGLTGFKPSPGRISRKGMAVPR